MCALFVSPSAATCFVSCVIAPTVCLHVFNQMCNHARISLFVHMHDHVCVFVCVCSGPLRSLSHEVCIDMHTRPTPTAVSCSPSDDTPLPPLWEERRRRRTVRRGGQRGADASLSEDKGGLRHPLFSFSLPLLPAFIGRASKSHSAYEKSSFFMPRKLAYRAHPPPNKNSPHICATPRP